MVAPAGAAAVQNTGKCPHGLPVGACPICNGMGGGASMRKDKPRVPGEMSYAECMAAWIKIQAAKEAKIEAQIQRLENAQIYAQAPEALGGISEKIQYYCYINEDRGHLYNWILNPENKFNKYLFLSFSSLSAVGYVGKQVANAIKEVIVNRENSKSELDLKKRLVETEINNFKAKKLSAINPHIDNFISQLEMGKSKEELKQIAENILIEIKNGPPYVYS